MGSEEQEGREDASYKYMTKCGGRYVIQHIRKVLGTTRRSARLIR